MKKQLRQRDFSEELQSLLKNEGTSWAKAADLLGKERNNIRNNVRRWLKKSEPIINAIGYTITFEKKPDRKLKKIKK